MSDQPQPGTCECCEITRDFPEHPRHCPSCLHCGARYIWRIQRLRRGVEETKAWCQKALADWMRLGGHVEAEIRALAKQAVMPIRPPPEKKTKAKKRR